LDNVYAPASNVFFQRATTLIFYWMVEKHFTLRLRIWKVDYGVKKELLNAEMAFG
jgi:hypothetical protein